ncbi:hypothetical protein J6590_011432 [Homalodisca vitripennis]|nr:hypothetical protein J6590_011432 [Homalodisca vitripennis]
MSEWSGFPPSAATADRYAYFRRMAPSSLLEETLSSDEESDVPADEIPDNVSMRDFSSSNEDENQLSDEDSSASDSETTLVHRLPQPPQPRTWIQVLPPEPDRNIEAEFSVRNPGIKDCLARNSRPIEYFYLFFTNYLWNLITNGTNFYAAKTMRDKGILVSLDDFLG